MTEEKGIVQASEQAQSISVRDVQQRQKAIWDLMANAMEKGTDYGITPGCGDKPSLYKPGSEKILSMFQFAVEPHVEDLCPLGGGTYDEYRIRVYVQLQYRGAFVGKGVGECSSWEEKYKWRRAVSDAEFSYLEAKDPELVRVKFGKDWKTKKDYEVKQVRVPTADIANTVLKIGKKRSQIDATLTVTAASAIFSQDLEDMPEEIAAEIMEGQEHERKNKADQPTRAKRKEQPVESEKSRDPNCISEQQERMLYAIALKQIKLSDIELKEEVKRICGVEHVRDIKKANFQNILESIDPDAKYYTKSKSVQDEPGSNG